MDRVAFINRRLQYAVITPVLLLLVAAAILTFQIARLVDASKMVDHTDQVLTSSKEAQRLLVDQEASVRAFFLTGDEQYIREYERTATHAELRQMRALTLDNPVQTRRCDELLRLYELWAPNTATLKPGASAETVRLREARMDDLRAMFRSFDNEETRLRRERVVVLEAANTTSTIVAIVLLIVLAASIALVSRKQLRDISTTYVAALDAEESNRKEIEAEATVRGALARVVAAMQGDQSPEILADNALRELATSTGADVGAFYTSDGTTLHLQGGFALGDHAAKTIAHGEGLVGQCARDRKLVHRRDVPADYLDIASATGKHSPAEIVVVPAIVDHMVYAVIELGFLTAANATTTALIERVGEAIAIGVRASTTSARLHELLEESRRQAEELQTQQEELRSVNEELQQQTDEVVRASRYKSEFLANMSHELRTPLNSLLILAKLLSDNKTANLSNDQVEYAQTIHSAGTDLLALIDDILDLAKIEAGKVSFEFGKTTLQELVGPVTSLFMPIAKEKKLDLDVVIEGDAPVQTDMKRVRQILKNLLANAFKFTSRGSVKVRARVTSDGFEVNVTDTGIGIPANELGRIFEAFEQVHASTTRRFAGSGLGLSISRDLARGLGGDISVVSTIEKGSAFTLRLPKAHATIDPSVLRRVLVIERDDTERTAIVRLLARANVMVDAVATLKEAIEKLGASSFDCVVTELSLADADGVEVVDVLAKAGTPILVYTRRTLTQDEETRLRKHEATIVIKGARAPERLVDELSLALNGVSADLPLEQRRVLRRANKQDNALEGCTVLVAEDDVRSVFALTSLLEPHGATVLIARTGREALDILTTQKADVVLMDLMMPEVDGISAIEQLRSRGGFGASVPIIAVTAKAMPDDQERCLRAGANDYIAKPFDGDMLVSLVQVWAHR